MKILLVDDNQADLELIEYELRGLNADIIRCRSRLELLGAMHNGGIDVAVIDFWLPDLPWPATMDIVRARSPHCIIIITSGVLSEDNRGYDALRDGADDFVQKDRRNMLPHMIRREMIRRLAKIERTAVIDKIREGVAEADLQQPLDALPDA